MQLLFRLLKQSTWAFQMNAATYDRHIDYLIRVVEQDFRKVFLIEEIVTLGSVLKRTPLSGIEQPFFTVSLQNATKQVNGFWQGICLAK